MVAAFVGNVIHLAFQLGVHASHCYLCAFTQLMLPLWTFLAILIHLGGTAALHI